MIQLKDDFSFCQMNFKSYLSGEKIQSYQTRLSFLSPGILLPFLEVKLSGTCQDSITHFPNPDISNQCSDFVTNSYGESWDSSCWKSWVPLQNHWVPVQNKMSPWIFCNHTVNLRSDYKTLQVYWSKINFFYCKAQKRLKEISIVYKQPKEQPQKFTQTGYSTKTSSDRLMVLCIHGMHTTKYCASWGFLCFRDAVRRANKVTARGKLIPRPFQN